MNERLLSGMRLWQLNGRNEGGSGLIALRGDQRNLLERANVIDPASIDS